MCLLYEKTPSLVERVFFFLHGALHMGVGLFTKCLTKFTKSPNPVFPLTAQPAPWWNFCCDRHPTRRCSRNCLGRHLGQLPKYGMHYVWLTSLMHYTYVLSCLLHRTRLIIAQSSWNCGLVLRHGTDLESLTMIQYFIGLHCSKLNEFQRLHLCKETRASYEDESVIDRRKQTQAEQRDGENSKQ